MKKSPPRPETVARCADGDVVRTPVGCLLVSWLYKDRLPCVRLMDPTTLTPVSDPWQLKVDVAVLEVVRDQSSFYQGPRADTSGEADPLKGGK